MDLPHPVPSGSLKKIKNKITPMLPFYHGMEEIFCLAWVWEDGRWGNGGIGGKETMDLVQVTDGGNTLLQCLL